MGIRGLTSYLRPYFKKLYFETKPQRIGIDALSVLYMFKNHHDKLLGFLRNLKKQGHSLLFVYDGKPPVEKEVEVAKRMEMRDTPLEELEVLQGSAANLTLSHQEKRMINERIKNLSHQSWRMTHEMHNKFKDALWAENIPYVKALEEADTVLIDLYKFGKIDVIISSDMDYLMAGVGRLFIPVEVSSRPSFYDVCLDTILAGEYMNFDAFQEACILCGTDETKQYVRMDPHRAFSYIRYYGSIKNMIRLGKDFIPTNFTEEFLSDVKRWSSDGPWVHVRPDHLERIGIVL